GGGGPIVRDHRAGVGGAIVRDHRRQRDSDWRFASERDFGRTRIRGSLYKNAAEGLRVTSAVSRPPVAGTRVATAEVMRHRIHARGGAQAGVSVTRPGASAGAGAGQPPSPGAYPPPGRGYRPPSRGYQPVQPEPPVRSSAGISRPTYPPPSRGTYVPPPREAREPTYQPPSHGVRQPTFEPPPRPTRQPTYEPPSSGPASGSWLGGGGYTPP